MATNDRQERMIQATTIDEFMAIDYTFETLKIYRIEGGKAVFTVLNEKGRTIGEACRRRPHADCYVASKEDQLQ